MNRTFFDEVKARLSAFKVLEEGRAPSMSRRALLRNIGLTGGALAGGAFLPRLANAQTSELPTPGVASDATNSVSDSENITMADHKIGANIPASVGEVDHKANGFNPTDILTDFDYGKVSKLPNGQTLREWFIVGKDQDVEIIPGISFPAWTYNGRIPGPTLRATEGDRMRIHFRNESAMAHSIHFHGIHPFPMDGVPGAGPGPLATGGEFTYEFDAAPFGCHLYHCHNFPLARHFGKGMYGAFICDPKQGRPKADHEFMMFLNAFDLDFDDANEVYAVNSIPFHYQKNPIDIKVGDLVRIYLINGMEYDPINSFHLHANFFHYYPTGTSLQPSEFTDIISQMQAQRGILEFRYQFPGTFMFHAHKTEFAELGWNGAFHVTPRNA